MTKTPFSPVFSFTPSTCWPKRSRMAFCTSMARGRCPQGTQYSISTVGVVMAPCYVVAHEPVVAAGGGVAHGQDRLHHSRRPDKAHGGVPGCRERQASRELRRRNPGSTKYWERSTEEAGQRGLNAREGGRPASTCRLSSNMALLERENFLADLSTLLLQAADGEGRLLFLGGEAGIGKSELLRAFLSVTDARSHLGACDSLSTPRPLGPLLDMAAEAGPMGIGLSRHDIVNRSRDEVFTAFLDYLVSSVEPLVVVFEDVHWADEATPDLLRFLGRRLDPAKALMVASYRDDEVGTGHPLRLLMGDLATTRAYRRMQLTRLSLTAVEKLAAESDVDARELHRRTGGNPFYVTEVLASGERGVPTRVSDAVLARVARLSPENREVLDVCSVSGFRFEPQLVIDVIGPRVDTVAAFEQCT